MRRSHLIMILPLVLAGCSGSRTETITPAGELASATPQTVAEGTFAEGGATAITYDTAVVPAGSTAQIAYGLSAAKVTVRLSVTGLVADRAYGAHLHVKPCTAKPDQAGPHYQHTADPKASASPPSVDPEFANPDNEVWLDFTTDGDGSAIVSSVQPWAFEATRRPRSLIVHAERTRTADGEAGTAGARVACLTLPAA